jgi:23S rRNA pseudouridine2457 synthase
MSTYLIFNKPFQVLTQFTDENGRRTLKDFINVPGVYSAGRLDYDSEGLLILTDDGPMIHSMMDPKHKVAKEYFVQVEGEPTDTDLKKMAEGIKLKDGLTKPCQAYKIDEPSWLWERTPPIRERKNKPTTWLSITLTEGRNRQVRRMTAAIGYPTLRLLRFKIGNIRVDQLRSGEFREVDLNFLLDNGINYKPKKSSQKTASGKENKTRSTRPGSRPRRNRRSQNQTQKV